MTSLPKRKEQPDSYKIDFSSGPANRREHRRHDMEQQGIPVSRWDGTKRAPKDFGRLVDLSAGGVRIRTNQTNVKADGQIRVRLELPAYAGISPFIDASSENPQPKREWVGWMSIARVLPSPRPAKSNWRADWSIWMRWIAECSVCISRRSRWRRE
jgi:hypothetical protein